MDLPLAKLQLRRNGAGTWIYMSLNTTMEAVGIEEVEMYVLHRHNTVNYYISTQPILELCLTAEQRLGARLSTRWW